MTDRYLLRLSAKAAGIPASHWDLEGMRALGHTVTESMMWNPLTDDGAALRLAVKLGITIERDEYDGEFYSQAVPPGTHQGYDEPYGVDPCAATRRAIVRAAAEIGRAMP